MKKLTGLVAVLLAAATLGAGEASAQQRLPLLGSLVRVEQVGNNNGAAVAQTGQDSVAVVRQNGDNLNANIRQNGNRNRFLVRQRGTGSTVNATQNGNNNSMCLAQVGDNLNADVVQNGGDRAGVWVQTEHGVREHRSFGGRVCY
jgi:minor curlin subunit